MRISIFPLPGVILFLGLQLPLHIFEPRYRALVKDALARNRRIGMIQPQRAEEGAPLYQVGCLGKIDEVEALDDGRFNLILTGEARFKVIRELDAATPFRQVEGELLDNEDYPALSPVERASFEREARRFAETQGPPEASLPHDIPAAFRAADDRRCLPAQSHHGVADVPVLGRRRQCQ